MDIVNLEDYYQSLKIKKSDLINPTTSEICIEMAKMEEEAIQYKLKTEGKIINTNSLSFNDLVIVTLDDDTFIYYDHPCYCEKEIPFPKNEPIILAPNAMYLTQMYIKNKLNKPIDLTVVALVHKKREELISVNKLINKHNILFRSNCFWNF